MAYSLNLISKLYLYASVNNQGTQTSIINQGKEINLGGLILWGDGTLARLSLLCQPKVRFG